MTAAAIIALGLYVAGAFVTRLVVMLYNDDAPRWRKIDNGVSVALCIMWPCLAAFIALGATIGEIKRLRR